MDERALLLLGVLRVQSQHGYQINEFIERTLGRVTDMKKPTAYAILERLSAAATSPCGRSRRAVVRHARST
jgi:DNA-binding PadR family transcriptional regulator